MYLVLSPSVAFMVYDLDNDGYISNGELFQVLKMMVGKNLTDIQLQQIVDKRYPAVPHQTSIMEADKDKDGKISFEEFCGAVGSRSEISEKLTVTFD